MSEAHEKEQDQAEGAEPQKAESPKAAKPAKSAPKPPKKGFVRVKGLVNMTLHSGRSLVAGEEVDLAQAEAEQLAEDPRFEERPFFEEA